MIPRQHNNVKVLLLMDVGGTMDEHIARVEELFSAVKERVQAPPEFYCFHNCVLTSCGRTTARRFAESSPPGRHPAVQQGLQTRLRRRRHHEPYEILQPGGSVEYNNEEAGAGGCSAYCTSRVRVDQPGTTRRLGIPPEHRHRPPAHGQQDARFSTLKGLEDAGMRLLSK